MENVMVFDEEYNKFYCTKKCCQGLFAASIEAHLLLPIKTIKNGVASNVFCDYFHMLTTLAYDFCVDFDHLIAIFTKPNIYMCQQLMI